MHNLSLLKKETSVIILAFYIHRKTHGTPCFANAINHVAKNTLRIANIFLCL
jgi:hypothetical protein